MQRFLERLLRGALRGALKPILGPRVSIALQRRWLRATAVATATPRGTRRCRVAMNHLSAELSESNQPDSSRAILYLHGGGYCIGSAYASRPITGGLAKLTGAQVYAPDYRLAPEHPHPAAVDDALAAYCWLLAQGIAPQSIALAGDSAGGGLVLATTLAARDAGLPLPAALALISPWVDLACSGETLTTHAARDPMLTPQGLRRWATAYCGTQSPAQPACSPLFADLQGLPPLLIQAGSEEILLSDARRLQQKALAAKVNATLHEYAGLWHNFQLHAGLLRPSDAAIAQIAAFFNQHLHHADPVKLIRRGPLKLEGAAR